MILYYENMSAVNITKNLVQHNPLKHIDMHHHFIRELVEDKIISLNHDATKNQLENIFTKALDASQFEKLRNAIGLCIIENL